MSAGVWEVGGLVLVTIFTLARRARKKARFKRLAGVKLVSILRYAVKGLDPDPFVEIDLRGGRGGLPNDRRWALRYLEAPSGAINPSIKLAPGWTHKSQFLCAFNATKRLSCLETKFDDIGTCLTVKERSTQKVLLRESMIDAAGIQQIEQFFSRIARQPLKLLEGDHFGNSPCGVKGNGKLDIIHIVNMETLQCVSERIGIHLAPSRFRPNVVLQGLGPWEEFSLVGSNICIGGGIFHVINRTVRCAATHTDREDTKSGEMDIPAILEREFPEHGPFLGVYAQFVGPYLDGEGQGGFLRVGDGVRIAASA